MQQRPKTSSEASSESAKTAAGPSSQEATKSASEAPEEPNLSAAQCPRGPLATLACAWVFLAASIFARGGPSFRGIFGYCSQGYWLLVATTTLVLASIGISGVALASARCGPAPKFCMKQGEPKRPPDPDFPRPASDDFTWTPSAASKIAACSICAGCVAAMCGIGGGLVMGPQLLKMGFHPQVQSATSASTLLITSSSSALFFCLAQGAAPLDYAGYLMGATALGSVVGKSLVNQLVARYKRPSLIISLLAALVGGSAVVMFVTGLLKTLADIQEGRDMSFVNICDVTT